MRYALSIAAAWGAMVVGGSAAPGQTPASANTIAAENQLQGTTEWIVPHPDQAAIAGYVDRMGYTPGDQVTMFVDSHGDPFTYRVYRLGYYNGLGGREVLDQATPQPGIAQPTYTLSKPGHYLSAKWTPSASFQTGADWTSGFYLIVMHDDRNGARSYACFTLRALDPEPIVVELQTDTWTAYNDWGGLSAYSGAQRLSENRPWADEGGAAKFFQYDFPLVQFLEKRGYPISYATNDDLGAGTVAGPRTKLLIESGHPEYHTMAERNVITSLPGRGVSVAILGGNAWTTQVRIDQTTRIYELWRTKASDPVKGRYASVRWELLGWPQNQLTGSMQAWGRPGDHQVVTSARHWAWNGTGATDLERFIAPQGWEFDGVDANGWSPRNLTVLSKTAMRYWGAHQAPAYTDMTITDRPNGTFVFDAGQIGFNWTLAYPAIPGVDVTQWIHPRYPTRSPDSPRLHRLVGNLIHHATGIANPVPPLAGSAAPNGNRIVAPAASIVPAKTPLVVAWTRPPAAAVRIQVRFAGRLVARVPAGRQTWTGGSLSYGWHVIEVRSVDRGGHILVVRRTYVLAAPRDDPRFRYAFGLVRAYLA